MDYRLLHKRIDEFITSLSDELINWDTVFAVKDTDNPNVYSVRVIDKFWNRELTFNLNVRYWYMLKFDVNEKIEFMEMVRISKSINRILVDMQEKYSEIKPSKEGATGGNNNG